MSKTGNTVLPGSFESMASTMEARLDITSRPVYDGAKRKLVIAFDIGTTFSGASYCILDPGNVPTIQGVNAFPNQRMGPSTGSKIPSVLYYDQGGKVIAVGAEALREGIEFEAIENDWVKAEWFKLHLRAGHTRDSARVANEVPPLPLNKTVVEVFGDFIRYLMECTVAYIRDTHPNSAQLWESLKDNIAFALSHPNGWEGLEQSQMRQAAIHSGIIEDTKGGHAQITFITEGEASLHFAIEHGVFKDANLKDGDGVVVVDAGGGTIDVSAYTHGHANPDQPGETLVFKEAFIPQSYFQGSVFVTVRAMDYLRALLANSNYLMDIEHIARCFDESGKVRFRDATGPQYIKFGSAKDNDSQVNIRFGQIKIPGKDVAEFFEPSVQCVVDAVKEQTKTKPEKFTHVVLVGGFSASQWLFNRVRTELSSSGLDVVRVEHHANKAVSNGSVSFYLDRKVHSRLTKVAYGTEALILYDPEDPTHFVRKNNVIDTRTGGGLWLPNHFATILKKGLEIPSGRHVFQESHVVNTTTADERQSVSTTLMCYRGNDPSPQWTDSEPDQYAPLCTIQGDLSDAAILTLSEPETGNTYYSFEFYVKLCFDEGELSAYFEWQNAEGDWKTGPAIIIYHPFDPVPMGDPLGPLVSGEPLLPAQTPNQEGSLDEVQGKVKDSKLEEVSPPAPKAREDQETIETACPTCGCTCKSKN